jgi:hypothetical protein
LLYRVFIKSVGFEYLQPFNLIFVLAGFFTYSIDKLLPPAIFIIENQGFNKVEKKSKLQSYLSVGFLVLCLIAAGIFYANDIYPWASISIVSLCMAVYAAGFFSEYKTARFSLLIKLILLVICILGIISIVHCFVFNVLLNVYLFIFIIAFFLFDILHPYLKENSRSTK